VSQEDVLEFLNENDGEAFFQDIVDEIDLSHQSLHSNVQRLLRWREVRKVKIGREIKVILERDIDG